MPLDNRSGTIRIQEYEGFGGSKFDAKHLSRFYNYDKPHDFGVMVSKIFSSSNKFNYKPLTAYTNAVGNSFEIPGNLYRWSLVGDDYRYATVMTNLEASNTRPGWNLAEFKLGLSEPWYKQPDVLMAEDNNYLLRVIGEPLQRGNYYEYTVQLQTSDPNTFIDPMYLTEGRRFCKVTTQVAIEMNQDYGTTSMGSQIDLQSQIGAYAEEFSVSDRVIREEILAKRKGAKGAGKSSTPWTSGYLFVPSKNGKPINKGMFITYMEEDCLERTEMDREINMIYGKTSTQLDSSGRYVMRTGPGLRELQKDGWEWIHNGSITASNLEDFLMGMFMTRVDEGQRDVVLSTGTLGSRIFDQLLSDEAGAFLTVDTNYVRQIPGEKPGMLEYGYQFKKFVGRNGVSVTLQMDPFKDDKRYCGRTYPNNPQYPIDSARMDIMDFGPQGISAAPNRQNISMVKTELADEYYWLTGAVDVNTGNLNSGQVTNSPIKEATCRRATTGGLVVWDTSRIGAIIYDPVA